MNDKYISYISNDSKQYFAFNIWSIESAKAVLDAAAGLEEAVILQTSMKAFERLDKAELRAFVSSYSQRKEVPAYLHLDHCKQLDGIREAIRCGWDSVMLDASDKPLEENIRLTNEVCALAKERGILVETEVGQIGGTEDDTSVTENGVASLEHVERFLQAAGADMLAAAVGTAHGLYQGAPRLHYDLIEKIGRISDIPLVIHGGTGLTDETFLRLLSFPNIKKINISTDVKLAYRRGITQSFEKGYMDKNHFDPLRVTALIHDSIESMAADRLKLLRRL